MNNSIKRKLGYFFVVAVALATASCAVVDGQRKQFEKLINNNQYEKAEQMVDSRSKRVFNGRVYEIQGNYKEAYATYIKELESLKNSNSKETYAIRAVLLKRMCYCILKNNGDYGYIDRLTEYVIQNETSKDIEMRRLFGNLDKDEQYVLLQGLTLVHLFFTNNNKSLFKVFSKCKVLLEEKKKQFILDPIEWASNIFMDETFIDMFLGYSKLEQGDLNEVYLLQKRLESVYDSTLTKTLLWGAETLNIFNTERAIVVGLGAYGYTILGQYKSSKTFFLKAIDAFEDKYPEKAFDRIIFGGLHLAYAYSYLIPTKADYSLTEKYLKKGTEILNFKIDNYSKLNDNVDFFHSMIDSGLHLANAKLYCANKQWDKCFSEASYVIKQLDRASPKTITTEALYLAFLSEKENSSKHSMEELNKLYAKSLDNLKGYDGYELWKMHYIDSLLKERKGDISGALSAAKQSVSYLEKFWNGRFPLSQQVTFMEDKNIPYQRTIELLLKRKNKNKTQELFEYIEKLKYHSVVVSSDEAGKTLYNPPSLKETQERLADGEAIIEFYYSQNNLLSIFIDKSEATLKVSDYSEKELNQALKKFEESISSDEERDDYDYVKLGHNLYSRLIMPYKDKITKKRKIFIVPHRELHYLPWNALSTASENNGDKFIINEPYLVTTIPSAIAFKIPSASNNKTRECSSFFIGPDISGSDDIVKEAKEYTCSVFSGERATKKVFLGELKKTKNVILLAHGTPNKELSPFESNIKLYKEELSIHDILNSSVYSNFVFLSGCGTGYAKRYSELKLTDEERVSESDDLLGIYKTFFSKGVNSVAVSLIADTNKDSNTVFVKNILLALKNNSNTPDAFKQAVLSLKKSKSLYSHPHHWGAYMLAGGITK